MKRMGLTFSRNASSHQNSAWGDTGCAQPCSWRDLLLCRLGQHLTSSKKCSWRTLADVSQKWHGQGRCFAWHKLASVHFSVFCWVEGADVDEFGAKVGLAMPQNPRAVNEWCREDQDLPSCQAHLQRSPWIKAVLHFL